MAGAALRRREGGVAPERECGGRDTHATVVCGMIGVFDSGIGGLSVLAAIARALPRADLIYLADTAHLPYGDKDDAYIRRRVLRIGRHLVERGCGVIVVACNTATAAAVAAFRKAFPDVAVVGVEPGVKPAAAMSRSGQIAVLATTSTARSRRLAQLIRRHAGEVQVRIEACPGAKSNAPFSCK